MDKIRKIYNVYSYDFRVKTDYDKALSHSYYGKDDIRNFQLPIYIDAKLIAQLMCKPIELVNFDTKRIHFIDSRDTLFGIRIKRLVNYRYQSKGYDVQEFKVITRKRSNHLNYLQYGEPMKPKDMRQYRNPYHLKAEDYFTLKTAYNIGLPYSDADKLKLTPKVNDINSRIFVTKSYVLNYKYNLQPIFALVRHLMDDQDPLPRLNLLNRLYRAENQRLVNMFPIEFGMYNVYYINNQWYFNQLFHFYI